MRRRRPWSSVICELATRRVRGGRAPEVSTAHDRWPPDGPSWPIAWLVHSCYRSYSSPMSVSFRYFRLVRRGSLSLVNNAMSVVATSIAVARINTAPSVELTVERCLVTTSSPWRRGLLCDRGAMVRCLHASCMWQHSASLVAAAAHFCWTDQKRLTMHLKSFALWSYRNLFLVEKKAPNKE